MAYQCIYIYVCIYIYHTSLLFGGFWSGVLFKRVYKHYIHLNCFETSEWFFLVSYWNHHSTKKLSVLSILFHIKWSSWWPSCQNSYQLPSTEPFFPGPDLDFLESDTETNEQQKVPWKNDGWEMILFLFCRWIRPIFMGLQLLAVGRIAQMGYCRWFRNPQANHLRCIKTL